MGLKLSLTVFPRWITNREKTQKIGLEMAKANITTEMTGLPGLCFIPVSLVAFTDKKTGNLRAPMVSVGQPTYKTVDKQSGKTVRRISYLTVHLNGEAAKRVEELVPVEWMKGCAKELKADQKATNGKLAYEYNLDEKKSKWIFDAKRALVGGLNAEDSAIITDFASEADEFANKADHVPAINENNVEFAGDDKTADEVLGN